MALLICCLGLDQSVAVAVAVLLACFTRGSQEKSPEFVGAFKKVGTKDEVRFSPEPVTKVDVRQRLGYISCYYPQARPTRGMLKQVYNFFQPEFGI